MKFALLNPESSSNTDTSSIHERGGISSSTIVAMPRPSTMVALIALSRSRKKCSEALSYSVSPKILTVIQPFVAPGGITSRPLVAPKSSTAVAVPLDEAKSTATWSALMSLRRTVKVTLVTPASPSSTDTSSMLTNGASSMIVQRPLASSRMAFDGLPRLTKKSSETPSPIMSPITSTVTAPVMLPAGTITVPFVAR